MQQQEDVDWIDEPKKKNLSPGRQECVDWINETRLSLGQHNNKMRTSIGSTS